MFPSAYQQPHLDQHEAISHAALEFYGKKIPSPDLTPRCENSTKPLIEPAQARHQLKGLESDTGSNSHRSPSAMRNASNFPKSNGSRASLNHSSSRGSALEDTLKRRKRNSIKESVKLIEGEKDPLYKAGCNILKAPLPGGIS